MVTMLDYDFMRTAFAASAIVALLAGATGWFLVLRGQSFAGHALSHIGFAGAAGALLLSVSPLWGLLVFTMMGGAAMGVAGEAASSRELFTGMVLSVSLGFGLLFLHLLHGSAAQASALLFGNVLGVDHATLLALALLGFVCLGVLGWIARPLLFASLMPDVAEARGVPVRALSLVFLLLTAAVTAECAQVTGVLLVFTLMIGPAASAHRLGLAPRSGLACSVGLALLQAWGGITLSWFTDAPASFWISLLSTGCFCATFLRPRY